MRWYTKFNCWMAFFLLRSKLSHGFGRDFDMIWKLLGNPVKKKNKIFSSARMNLVMVFGLHSLSFFSRSSPIRSSIQILMMRKLSFVNASQMFSLEQIAQPNENVACMGNGNDFMAFERAMQRIYNIQIQYECEINSESRNLNVACKKGHFISNLFYKRFIRNPPIFVYGLKHFHCLFNWMASVTDKNKLWNAVCSDYKGDTVVEFFISRIRNVTSSKQLRSHY